MSEKDFKAFDRLRLIYDHGPSDKYEMAVLAALFSWADAEGYAYPGVSKLARAVRMTVRGVQQIIRRLEDGEYIAVSFETSEFGTNEYFINYHLLKRRAAAAPPEQSSPRPPARRSPLALNGVHPAPEPDSVTPRTPEHLGVNPDTPKLPITTIEPPTRAKRGGVDDLFSDFWEVYPHRVEETAAQRAWGKVASAENAKAIIAAAEAYADDDRVKRGFPKQPSNWLMDRCWQDAPAQQRSEVASVDLGALSDLWAPKIAAGSFVPSSAISASLARHMVSTGAVTRDQLRKAGVSA